MINKKITAEAKINSEKDLKSILLPKPDINSSGTVLKALKQRKTVREISDRMLPQQVLSNLLWSACGINRKRGPFGIPGRTSATASNSQEIDLYVTLKEGIYLYDSSSHKLIPVIEGDFRSLAIGAGQSDLGDKAPVRFIFIADIDKLINTAGYKEPGLLDHEIQKSYYFVDTGIIASNIYLYSASIGLAAWFHNCNRSALTKILNLRSEQKILFGQTVGYPSK